MRGILRAGAVAAAVAACVGAVGLSSCAKKQAQESVPETLTVAETDSATPSARGKPEASDPNTLNNRRDSSIVFIGYDGQSPIFESSKWKGSTYMGHNGIYMYTNKRLVKQDIPIQEDIRCLNVKNDVYVFGYVDSLRHPTKIQFRRNGRDIFFEQAVSSWTEYFDDNHTTMNNKEFFAIAWRKGDSVSMIFRLKYRDKVQIDTIVINGYCFCLLDATNDHLYYIVKYPQDPNDIQFGPLGGSLYRMNLKTAAVDELVKNVSTGNPENTAIVPRLNIVYSSGNIVDYNQNANIWAKDYADTFDKRVFFSYEHNAFVIFKHSMNINRWECLNLAPGGKLPAELRAVPCFNENRGTK